MSLLPALEESEKTSSHGWSAASRFGADMENSQSNLYHQLISQNNSGDVPDALVEEEIYEGGEESGMSVAYNQHPQTVPVQPAVQAASYKQQILQQQKQQQVARKQIQQQQHVNQQVRNYLQQQQQQPATPKQQNIVYSVVTPGQQHTNSQSMLQTENQQLSNNTGRQQILQNVLQQTSTQTPSQTEVKIHIQNPKVLNYNQSKQPQQPPQQQQKQQQQGYSSLLPEKVQTEEEVNYKLQMQQKEIEKNNLILAQYGMPTVSVSPQQSQSKGDYIGTVKVQNSHNPQSSQSTNNVRQLLLINNAQANNRKVGVQQVVNNNGANSSRSLTPQSQTVLTSAGGITNPNQNVVSPQQTNSAVITKGSNIVLNQSSQGVRHDPLAGEVSREKVALEGGGQFEEGQPYLIHSKDGRTRTMMLKNGKFVPYEIEKGIIQHSAIDSSQRGRGRGRGKHSPGRGRGNLHGNATGVNMVQKSRGQVQGIRPTGTPGTQQIRSQMVVRDPNMRINSNIGRQDFLQARDAAAGPRHQMPSPNAVITTRGPGQTFQRPPIQLKNLMPAAQVSVKNAADTTSSLVRRPLHPDTNSEEATTNHQEAEVCTSNVSSQQTEAVEKVEKQDLPNTPTDPNVVAICQFCGYQSEDKVKCIRCARRFTNATKFVSLVKVNVGSVSSNAKRRKLEVTKDSGGRGGISKKIFYSKKLEEQNQIYTEVIQAANNGKTVLRTTRIVRRGQGNRRMRGRGRARGIIVPETVTISSDEEEESTTGQIQKMELALPVVQAPPTPQTSQGSVGSKSSSSECPESPLIPTIPISQRNVCRIGKMEDEKGTSGPSRENTPSPVQPPQLLLNARVVRVGTLKGTPIEPILLNQDGFSFNIEDPKGSHKFHIYPQEIQQCLVKFDESSFIFFLTTHVCGERTRENLGIPHHKNPALPPPDPYFDPTGMYMPHQMIMVVLDKVEIKAQMEFQKHLDIFKTYGKQGDEAFYMELNTDEANDVLKQISRKDPMPQLVMTQQQQSMLTPDQQYSQQAAEGQQSRSPSPPRMGFVGPIIKLLTYPPPPYKGALSITNEDMYCLQEGEFLNDVIIDFYLKYVLLEKMSEEDRSRTHIFSSFFYKRLTQRIRGAAIDDDPSLSLAVKRHARVKRWTRHVDLFQKDFIIVPINEHSHWFLAIICFPGMGEPSENLYIPKPIGPILPEPANAPTPPQPTEDGEQEQMETEESETEANTSKVADNATDKTPETTTSTVPQDEVKTDETVKTETENNQKEESCENDKSKNETNVENTDKSQDSDKNNTTVDKAGTDTHVEENKSDQTEKQQTEVKESDSVEDKDKTKASAESEAATDKAVVSSSATNTSGKSSGTNTSSRSNTPTSTSSTCVGTSTTVFPRPVLVRMGSRGKAVINEDEEKEESLFTGIKQPCIMVFDSLSGPPRSRIVQVLKEYLQVEWATKKGGELNRSIIKGCVPKVPQQNNYSDCGIYLLQYVESFFEDPLQDFTIPIRGLHDWFSINKISGKREEIRELIIDLKDKLENPASKEKAS